MAETTNTDSDAIRKAASVAQVNEKAFGPVAFEIVVIAAAYGWYQDSWLQFACAFFGLLAALVIKPLAIILIAALSVAWGYIGYMIGSLFDSQPAQLILGGMGFLLGLALHMAAARFAQDLAESSDQKTPKDSAS